MSKYGEDLYPEIAKFILSILKDKKSRDDLPDQLVKELGFAANNIMEPMKAIINKRIEAWEGPITEMIMSGHSDLQLLGARFTSTHVVFENADAYRELKETFVGISDNDDAKPFYGAAVFFFRNYSADTGFHATLKEYYERTIAEQIPLAIHNYGGVEAARTGLEVALSDPDKANKHWCYRIFLDNLPKSRLNPSDIDSSK